MTKKDIFPSRKGYKRILCEKIIKIIITFIIGFFIIFGDGCIAYSSDGLTVYAQENLNFEKGIIENHAKSLEDKGYKNVEYRQSPLIKYSFNNNFIKKDLSLKDFYTKNTLINTYDYLATYYSVQIGEKEYLFKNEENANSFVQEISKYDSQEYAIKTTTKIVEKETKENEINEAVEAKKSEYEEAQAKARAEAEARRKAEEAARNNAASEQEQTKSTTTYSSNLSALQAYAYNLVINIYGWNENDFVALVNLWNRESGWNPNAHNNSSGAHGIPQSLPASKMASEGADYYTNGETQIRWGLKYIAQRYGSPSAAWSHSQQKGWY